MSRIHWAEYYESSGETGARVNMQRISSLILLLGRLQASTRWSPKLALLAVLVVSLPLTGVSRPVAQQERALCCLCTCHSADENRCAQVCVKMQHGRKIIEEPQMNACTRSCLRHGVQQIFFSEDGTQFVIIPTSSK